MRFFLILLISFLSFTLSAQTDVVCPCAAITANTTTWGKTSRGNEYCTYTTSSGKTAKEYKKYFGTNPPTKLTANDTAKRKVWRKVGKGKNVGKWYKGKAKKTT